MKVKLNGNPFYEVTCPFGSTDPLHPLGHKGIDLAIPSGTPIHSPINGVVEKVVDYGNTNLGKGIFIKGENGETLIFGHMSDTSMVDVGEKIALGEKIGLSGNTGRSTGSHLHFSVKDANGNFINPDNYVIDEKELTAIQKFFENGKVPTDDKYGEGFLGIINDDGIIPLPDGSKGFIESIQSLHEFSQSVKEIGFFRTLYGKSFFEVTVDFFSQLFADIFHFVVAHGDIFFVAPAIFIMFATFMVGRNKYTKFIIPLWFVYFISIILNIQINA